MSYFKNFPSVPYKFELKDGTQESVNFTNLITYSDVIEQLIEDKTLYSVYEIPDGDRADTVSYNLYGTSEYYWTFYLLNPDIRSQGWPLSTRELAVKLESDIGGQCLVFMPQDEIDRGNETNWLQHQMIEQFPIGSDVYQSQGSGTTAHGVVYARNVNLGQIFVKNSGDVSFMIDLPVTDSLTSPQYSLTPRIVHNPASLAVHHFEDGDGDHVDVDYSIDFRGRGPESDPDNVSGLPDGAGPESDGNYLGGVVGDIEHPDPYSSTGPYSLITYKEHYDNENLKLSRIKIIKPDVIDRFVALHRQSVED